MTHPTTLHRPACPRCRLSSGLLLEHPAGPYNNVYRCDGRLNGCGYLWSPRDVVVALPARER